MQDLITLYLLQVFIDFFPVINRRKQVREFAGEH